MVRSDFQPWHAIILSVAALTGISLACGTAVAQDSDTAPQPLKMRTTAEFLDKQERISGGATVGVAFYDSTDEVNLDKAWVYFSEPVNDPLEMQLSSVDGRYVAIFDYTPKQPISGWVPLELSLDHPDFVTNYNVNEVALLLTNARTGTAYPVRWSEEEETTDVVRVYVNTEGAKSYFVTFDAAENRWKTRSCTVASPRSSFKFDRICDVPVADVIANNDIEIVRKRGANFGTPLTVNVLLTEPGNH